MMVATVITQPTGVDRRVQKEIGPRTPGVEYYNPTGTFEVLQVLRGAEASAALGRRTAWAVKVRRRNTGEVTVHCMTWTNSDHVMPVKATKVRTAAEIREDLADGTVSAVDCDVLTNLAEVAAYGTSAGAVTTR